MFIADLHPMNEAAGRTRPCDRDCGTTGHRGVRRDLPAVGGIALFTFLTLAGCTEAEPVGPLADADEAATITELPADVERAQKQAALATLRRATAAYHDSEAALEDGFESLGVCVEANPIDGQHPLGIPFVHLERVVDGVLDPEEPEILFYEPRKDGSLRLVGVEMAVPVALWTEDDPPEFFGHELHENEAEGLYGLHMWIWLHNPDGMFAPGHPRISCEFAS
ncbi:MAG: hypothetical protein ACOC9H_00270 [Gemmatimonadota bacterium]